MRNFASIFNPGNKRGNGGGLKNMGFILVFAFDKGVRHLNRYLTLPHWKLKITN